MKNNWIEMLFDLFEKGLDNLKELQAKQDTEENEVVTPETEEELPDVATFSHQSFRVLSADEQYRLTKPSWQYLLKMKELGVVSVENFENIMNLLQFSESPVIVLDEVKWAIRKTLSAQLDYKQLRFLDLILYHKEQEVALH